MRFCRVATAIGPVAVIWSDRGVTHIFLPPISCREVLARAGPDAEDVDLADCGVADALARYLAGGIEPLDFPIDLQDATPFQRRVYAEVRTIGYADVRTYGEVASAIGRPGAARAVGAAMAKNPVPLVVPCHRVVSAAGTGGFSAPGGTALKKRLLAMERRHASVEGIKAVSVKARLRV